MSFVKRWAPLVVLIGIAAAIYISGVYKVVSLQELQANKDVIADWISDNYVVSLFAFFLIYVVSVVLSLPIASLLTFSAGFFFGWGVGVALVATAATAGATILFLVARSSVGATLRKKADGIYVKISQNMQENAVSYLLFMRLVPIFPFFLVNIVPALFNLRISVAVLTCFFGILPGTCVYVYVGQQLGEVSALSDLVSPSMILAFSLLGAMALIPSLYKKWRQHAK